MFQQLRLFQFQEPSPPKRFRWSVEDESSTFTCSAVPEKRGRNTYWYVRKSIDGKTVNIYVAPAGKLSEQLLDNAVINIKSQFTIMQEKAQVLQ